MLKRTFWKSTTVIGHRGAGADAYSKSGKYRRLIDHIEANADISMRTHIMENTILSFVTAASLGAEYVEFDVHLTKDRIPVIYHDFTFPHASTGIRIPITNITLEEFRKLHDSEESLKEESSHAISRSKSWGEFSKKDFEIDQLKRDAKIRDEHPTFRELFERVPSQTGFNVEVKYPTPEKEVHLGMRAVERNELVDIILKEVFDHAKDRNLFFSSFDPDICILLRLKQPRYPVFFLTQGGEVKRSDPRMNSLQQAVRFAKSANLMGIVSSATPILMAPQLVRSVKRAGLIFCTYGSANNLTANIDLQEKFGMDAIIVDHVAYVSNHMRPKSKKPKKLNS